MASKPSDTIKVTVHFTVEVSRDAWESNYGVEGTQAIREDVKLWAENAINDHLRALDLTSE